MLKLPNTLVFAYALGAAATVLAQSPQARLLVTVIDQTRAVLPAATVTIAGEDTATRSVRVTKEASNVGVATFDRLVPGRYTIQAEFPGFEPAVVRDVRVRAGDTRRTVMLQLKKLDETVSVGRDAQTSALDARGAAFSTVLTREQIEALPDDPDEMEAVLKAMAPPGSTIRVDGFTGGRMPPKSQIRSIRLPRMDMFAAQNHGGLMGALFIDILTQPGSGPLRGNVDFTFLDDALNARNVLTPRKGDEQLRQYGFNLFGTIAPNRTSFSLFANGASQYFSSNLYALLPDGTRRQEALKQPQDRLVVNGRIDHALTKGHLLRVSVDRTQSDSRNLGVGEFDLPDRAFSTDSSTTLLRISENGPVGRRFFSESRLQILWSSSESHAAVEAPTLRVNDAFTTGGAQVRGGRRDVAVEFASDLDYVRGNHSWRTGVLVEGGRYRSDDISNYLGTYTFASLEDYLAGRPSVYSRRIGDPNLRYSTLQAAVYLQDDWRILRSLLLSPGVRYGYQLHVSDGWNLSPRFSAAWSPFRSGNLTFRGSYGYFYDWIGPDVYKQTLLIDGFRQRELNVRNPSYPVVEGEGMTPPTNRYLWSDDLLLPTAHRLAAGVDRALSPTMRVSANYTAGWGRSLLRPRNLNAPVAGVRPDPAFANVVELVSDAASSQHALNIGWNLTLLQRRRTLLFFNYTLATNSTNTAGPFALLPHGDDLEREWGPAPGDLRHRFGGSFNMQPVSSLSVAVNASVRSGLPYTITTGRDDNGDGVFNDRPVGVGRNSARGAAVVEVGGRIAYAWGFGPPREGGPGGVGIVVVQGGGAGGPSPPPPGLTGPINRRFRLEVFATAQNLLNRTNYTAYSGVMTSPLFGQPTRAGLARRVQVGVRLGF